MNEPDTLGQLTIGGLQALLDQLRTAHGDLPVVLEDADTSWVFRLKADHLSVVGGPPAHRMRLWGRA